MQIKCQLTNNIIFTIYSIGFTAIPIQRTRGRPTLEPRSGRQIFVDRQFLPPDEIRPRRGGNRDDRAFQIVNFH